MRGLSSCVLWLIYQLDKRTNNSCRYTYYTDTDTDGDGDTDTEIHHVSAVRWAATPNPPDRGSLKCSSKNVNNFSALDAAEKSAPAPDLTPSWPRIALPYPPPAQRIWLECLSCRCSSSLLPKSLPKSMLMSMLMPSSLPLNGSQICLSVCLPVPLSVSQSGIWTAFNFIFFWYLFLIFRFAFFLFSLSCRVVCLIARWLHTSRNRCRKIQLELLLRLQLGLLRRRCRRRLPLGIGALRIQRRCVKFLELQLEMEMEMQMQMQMEPELDEDGVVMVVYPLPTLQG